MIRKLSRTSRSVLLPHKKANVVGLGLVVLTIAVVGVYLNKQAEQALTGEDLANFFNQHMN